MQQLIKSKMFCIFLKNHKKRYRGIMSLFLFSLIVRMILIVRTIHTIDYPKFISFEETIFASGTSTSFNETALSNTNLPTNFFSGCLLTKDDNHKLVEWLAYHHHVLPLQHLVVAVDPKSITSPKKLFNRWRMRGMIIEQWADENFMPPKELEWSRSNISTLRTDAGRYHLHKKRQKRFISHCLRHLRNQNRTWTILIDSDEYLQFNGPFGINNTNVTNVPYRSVQEQGAVLKFLEELDNRNETQPCVQIPRINFGNTETVNHTKGIPYAFNDVALDTIRYQKHGQRDNSMRRKYGQKQQVPPKSLIDLSKITIKDIKTASPHKAIGICSKAKSQRDSVFRINHYAGSWESFSFRKDARGIEKASIIYNDKIKDTNDGLTDDNIRPWINGFIDSHGEKESLALLKGAGVISDRDLLLQIHI